MEFTKLSSHGSNYKKMEFDDSIFLSKMDSIKVKKVNLYTAGSYLCGIQFFYEYKDTVVSNLHCTVAVDVLQKNNWVDYKGNYVTESTLELEDDDYICSCEIRSGAIIDKVTLKTKKGKSVSGGGNGGSATTYNAPNDKQIVGFVGSHPNSINRENTWATIHNLSTIYSSK